MFLPSPLPSLKFKCCQPCKRKCYLLNDILSVHFYNTNHGDYSSNLLLSKMYEMVVDQMLDCKNCVKQCEFYIYKWIEEIRIEPSYQSCLENRTLAIFQKDQLMGFSHLMLEPIEKSIPKIPLDV